MAERVEVAGDDDVRRVGSFQTSKTLTAGTPAAVPS
jgi:hypothetical protein